MFFSRFFSRSRKTVSDPPVAMPGNYRACDGLGATSRPFSPLVAEMMALYSHTRPIGALSQDERCADEYRLLARSVIHHILEGWQNQTGGRGTIDDLLLQPRPCGTKDVPARRRAENPDTARHRLAS